MALSSFSSEMANASSLNICYEREFKSFGLLSQIVPTSYLRSSSTLVQAELLIASLRIASRFIGSYIYQRLQSKPYKRLTQMTSLMRFNKSILFIYLIRLSSPIIMKQGETQRIIVIASRIPNILVKKTQTIFMHRQPTDNYKVYLLIFIRVKMSDDELQLLEQMDELPYQSLKCRNQWTAISFRHKNTNQSAVFDVQTQLQKSTDCSFEQTIHQQNVEILKNATVKYLEQTIGPENFKQEHGFKDQSLYEGLDLEPPIGNQLENITLYNNLLSQKEKQELLTFLKEEQELKGLLRQFTPAFGSSIAKELTLAVYMILKQKLSSYRKMKEPKDNILPRFDCFNGFEEQENPFNSACPIYEDFNLEEIPSLAEKQMDELCHQLEKCQNIKYLNLRVFKHDLKCSKSVFPNKFNAMIKQISKTLFYSLAGAIQPTQCANSMFTLDLNREVSFTEMFEGNILSIERSLSRPFVCGDDQHMDQLSKKLKFDS